MYRLFFCPYSQEMEDEADELLAARIAVGEAELSINRNKHLIGLLTAAAAVYGTVLAVYAALVLDDGKTSWLWEGVILNGGVVALFGLVYVTGMRLAKIVSVEEHVHELRVKVLKLERAEELEKRLPPQTLQAQSSLTKSWWRRLMEGTYGSL